MKDERIRVYHLITELEPAGAERVLFEIARGLDRNRFDVRIGALRGGGSVGVWLENEGLPVFSAGVGRGWRRFFGLRGVVRRVAADLREFAPDVLHTHLFHAGAIGRIAARRARVAHVVSHVHTVEGRTLPWRDWFDRWTLSWIEVEICVSLAVARNRSRRIGASAAMLRVVPNGVDLERARSTGVVTRMKQATGLIGTGPRVLAIGRLDRQKGFDVLIEAAPRLIEAIPDLEIAIVGEGPERAHLESQIKRLGLAGRVLLLGHREDIGRFLARSQVLAMPSRWEGFGITAVEAMAAGVPVVCSLVDSLPEIVRNEYCGLLVPPNDPTALAAALLAILSDPERRERMSIHCRAASERFTVKKMVDSCAMIYEELVESTKEESGRR